MKTRGFLLIILNALLILLVSILFLPTLVNTQLGKSLLIRTIGKGSIETMHLSWFRPQKISAANIITKEGNKLAFKELTADQGLFHYLFNRREIGTVKLVEPLIDWTVVKKQSADASSASLPSALPSGHLEIENGSVTLRKGKEILSLSKLALKLEGQIDEEFSLVVKGYCASSNSRSGKIEIDLKIAPSFSVLGTIYLDKVPFAFIAPFIENQKLQKLAATELFGPTVSMQFNPNLVNGKGNFKIDLFSEGLKLAAYCSVEKEQLQLTRPLSAEIAVNRELSDLLLANIDSLDDLKAEKPILLSIDPQGFLLPLKNPSDLTCPNLSIISGKMSCRSSGTLATVLNLLGLSNSSEKGKVDLWLAPLLLHIKKGEVAIERTEMLVANKFDIALWGDLSLAQNEVDLKIGLTRDCLKKAFGIKSELPENYTLQLPLKGKLSRARIDTKEATKKIILLRAWDQKAALLPKGKIGEFLSGALPPPDSNLETPKPKKPFPWER